MTVGLISYLFDDMDKNAKTLRGHSDVATTHIGKIKGKTIPGDDDVLADLQSAYSLLCESVGATLEGTKSFAEYAATQYEEMVGEGLAAETDNAAAFDGVKKSLEDGATVAPTPGATTPETSTPAETSATAGYNAPPLTTPTSQHGS